MHVFGLTGGMASGKSTVAKRFAARGLPIVDADAVSREVATPGSEAVKLVAAEFGEDMLFPDGSMDRKKVSLFVFGDKAKEARLNAIMLPRIRELSMKKIMDVASRGEPLACYDAALLVENGLADAFRPLVVVSAPAAVQVARAAARDGLSEEHVRARLAAQRPLEDKVAMADIVIVNDGSLELLQDRADEALDAVCRRVGVDPKRYAR
jgi:dephospho-CoA kinase